MALAADASTPLPEPLLPEVAPLRVAQRELVRELGLTEGLERELGATLAQCHALVEIDQTDRLSARELASRLVVDASTMSRLVERLVARGWVRQEPDPGDGRRKRLTLTAAGRRQVARAHARANAEAHAALSLLLPAERRTVVEGLRLYAKALRRHRRLRGVDIRSIRPADNAAMRDIIVRALVEHGVEGRPNPTYDADLDDLHGYYARPGAGYFVAVDPTVVGGAGYAPLVAEREACELRKMYVAESLRGCGLGLELLKVCLAAARRDGYRWCYLNTMDRLRSAVRLYESFGFEATTRAAAAGSGCDRWYRLSLV
jgi:putative acetyltransferase